MVGLVEIVGIAAVALIGYAAAKRAGLDDPTPRDEVRAFEMA